MFGRKEDNYYDKGAGYFTVSFDGIEFEMMGKRGNVSLDLLPPDLRSVPTKIQVGGVWARVHANPGQYVRGRYGKGYLKHAQSWRYVGEEHTPGLWQRRAS